MKTLLVCGRFQPFHNGHLAFVSKASKMHGGPIIIGIIINSLHAASGKVQNPLGDAGDEAQTPKKNPFSIYERLACIREIVAGTDFADRCEVTAFPRPELYWELVSGICSSERVWALPGILDSFDQKKFDFYRSHGDEILSISDERFTSGTEIRRLVRSDPEKLKKLLPRPSYKLAMKHFSNVELG